MAINTTFRTVKLDYENILDPKQIVMQCNLDTSAKGGVSKVCFVSGDAQVTKAQSLSKQIKVNGRATIKVVYLDDEGQMKSFDYISDFVEDINDDAVTANMEARVDAEIIDNECVVAGKEIKIQLVIQLCPVIIESMTNECLSEIDGALQKRNCMSAPTFVRNACEEMEIADEYDTGVAVDEIILFDSKVIVEQTECGEGNITVSGRAQSNIIYRSEGKVTPKTIVIPFAFELENTENMQACLCACIKDSKIIILGTEKENVLRIELIVAFSGAIMKEEDIELIADVFCPTQVLKMSTKECKYTRKQNMKPFSERISGVAGISTNESSIHRLVCANEISCAISNVVGGKDIISCEGLVVACVIYEAENGTIQSVQIELPFALQFDKKGVDEKCRFNAKCLPCDMTTKVKRDREIEISINLIIAVEMITEYNDNAIILLEEGEEIEANTNAVTVYIPHYGETMWEIAKELAMPMSEIIEQNPNIGNIMNGEERIIVYRELKA